MKQLFLLAGLASATGAWAQAPAATVVAVGAFGLAPNVGIQLEHRLAPRFSLGLQGTRFWGSEYPGYQAALLGRYYFRPTAPAGFYAQAKVGVFSMMDKLRRIIPVQVIRPAMCGSAARAAGSAWATRCC